MKTMSNLIDKIKNASQAYYTDGSSNLSDKEFDALIGQLKEEDPDSPLLNTGHGFDIFSVPGTKAQHLYGEVGSLAKCHTYLEIKKDIRNKFEEHGVLVSLKLDGLSVVLYYEKGRFIRAVTRGKGNIGIDITDKVDYILNNQYGIIPTAGDFTGAFRGEILMTESNFKKFKKINPSAKNSRNSTAGIINGKEITDDLKFVNIYLYSIVGCENNPTMYTDNANHHDSFVIKSSGHSTSIKSYYDILEFIYSVFAGYTVPNEWLGNVFSGISTSESLFEDIMQNCKTKWYGELPADGIVIASDSFHRDGNNIEYWSVAYKFPTDCKPTKVVDIVWELTKTRYLMPRVKVEPVELAGSTVQYSTGINAQYIKESGIGIGSQVMITKANEIIPQITDVLTKADYVLPTHCPVCGEPLVWKGVHLQCKNPDCFNANIQDVLVWFNKLAPTEGLGNTLICKFLGDMFGKSASIEKIYIYGKIDETSESIQYNKFVQAYNTLFDGKFLLSDAIEALNIPGFGTVTANKLSKHSAEIKKFLSSSELCDISWAKDIGNANYDILIEHCDKLRRLSFIKDNIIWEETTSKEEIAVCITGKLSVKRSEFESELKAAGFTPVSSVTKKTQYLITDNPNSGSSKNTAAKKFGTVVMSEQEFRNKFIVTT
jgi:DNA ligase (NAD+)